jgi:uncharacterized protein (TIGR02679 family)
VTVDHERLARLLGGDDVRWLVDRVRDRLERGGMATGTVTLRSPTDRQRAAVAVLVGTRRGAGATLVVPLEQVEAVLRRSGAAPDLRAAVETLTGPVVDRAAARDRAERAWAAVTAGLDDLAASDARLAPWRDEVVGTGMLRRLTGGDADAGAGLVAQCAALLDRLPAGGVSRSRLAAETVGDAHALDRGRPLATLTLKAAAHLSGLSWGASAEAQRTLWAGVGVLVGELSAPVLTLGLPGDAGTATGRVLGVWREAGQPVHITLRQLVADPPAFPGTAVFVCENPSVVAHAAAVLGSDCAPLVCIESHPAAAQLTLLRQLAAADTELRYHGDFDWPGVTIANGVMRRLPIAPWRFRAADYTAAVAAGLGSVLSGRPVTASWDPALTTRMRACGRKVEEEHLLADLLTDLDDA